MAISTEATSLRALPRLRERRRELGLSRAEAARRAGVPATWWWNRENTDATTHQTGRVERAAVALDIDVWEIFQPLSWPPPDAPDDIIRIRDAEELLGPGRQTLHNWRTDGRIRAWEHPVRGWWVSASEVGRVIRESMAQRGAGAAGPDKMPTTERRLMVRGLYQAENSIEEIEAFTGFPVETIERDLERTFSCKYCEQWFAPEWFKGPDEHDYCSPAHSAAAQRAVSHICPNPSCSEPLGEQPFEKGGIWFHSEACAAPLEVDRVPYSLRLRWRIECACGCGQTTLVPFAQRRQRYVSITHAKLDTHRRDPLSHARAVALGAIYLPTIASREAAQALLDTVDLDELRALSSRIVGRLNTYLAKDKPNGAPPKLTEEKCLEIRQRYTSDTSATVRSLAVEYGVSKSLISTVIGKK